MSHNHSFDFVTCGYFGPGYTTRILEVDPDLITGDLDEFVELNFLEETTLPIGKVMIYRAYRDVHTQFPPPELSISLNLMCLNGHDLNAEQYFFNEQTGRIIGYPKEGLVSRRAKLVELASLIGNDETFEILIDIAVKDNNIRTRREAINGIATGRPDLMENLYAKLGVRPDHQTKLLLSHIDLLLES
ncbi:hypothetical protein GCM10027066_15640 [Dyella jejuensis]